MSQSVARNLTTLTHSWATFLKGLSDPALLLDASERLVAHNRAARALLGSVVDLPGVPAHAVLGLGANAALNGQVVLRPPASGLTIHAQLCRLPLCDEHGVSAGIVLLLDVGLVQEPTPRAAHVERRLRDVALTISSNLEIGQVLDQVLRLSVDLFGAAAGSLPLYDAHFDRLLPAHVVGIAALDFKRPMYRGNGAIWDLIDTGEYYLNNSYASDPRALAGLVAVGVHAVAAVAVRAGEQLLGVINLYHTAPERNFTPYDIELLEIIGRHAGVALQNARRYAEVQRESERRHQLYRASLAIGGALAPEQLYTLTHQALRQMMRCDTMAIALLDADADEIDYVYMVDGRGRWPGRRLPLSRGLLGMIIRTGLSMRITGCNPELEAMFDAEPFGEGEDPTGSLMAAALQVGEQINGAITVQAIGYDAFTAADLDVLESLAATVAIALQNARLFAQVQELATIDPLTGAANRRYFFEQARLEVERAARYERPLSLLMIDADHFKQINDQYGHTAGDEVLRTIVSRCRAGLREVDMLGRYGGEEFLVLLPETAATQALVVAERLRALVAETLVPTVAGPVTVRVSVGVASLSVGTVASFESLLDKVDRALYAAKAAGRNTARSGGR